MRNSFFWQKNEKKIYLHVNIYLYFKQVDPSPISKKYVYIWYGYYKY